MGVEPVTGAELRQVVGIARKQPLAFAFCIDSKNDDCLFIDRRKPPSTLGKEAKKQGGSPKVAFGVLTADANMITLACDMPLPNLAKRVRKYLKNNSVSAKVTTTDASGTILEEESDVGEVQAGAKHLAPKHEETVPTPDTRSTSEQSDQASDRPARQKASKHLRDLVLRAARIGPEAQQLAATEAKTISEKIKAGDLTFVSQSIVNLAQRIADMSRDIDAPSPDVTQPGPNALNRARQDWIAARKATAKDVRALIAAINAATKDEYRFRNAASQIVRKLQPLTQMDTTLETVLGELATADSAAKRRRLAVTARAHAQKHLKVVNSEFFKTIDSNGFVETSIRSTVTTTLRKVNDALKHIT